MLKKSGKIKGTAGFPTENPTVPFFIYTQLKRRHFYYLL